MLKLGRGRQLAIAQGLRHLSRAQVYSLSPAESPEVLWNFEKFLISRNGRAVATLAPDMAPDDPAIVAAIELHLADEGAAE